MDHDVLFARQPIYDNKNKIYAFELLYRGTLDVNDLNQGRQLTNEVLVNFCTGFMDDGYAMDKPVFINVDESFLLNTPLFPGSPQNVVLEILETVYPTEPVLKALSRLRKQGYRFALDDYVFSPHHAMFLPFVSIVKVDVLAMGIDTLREHLRSNSLSKKVLLAEKVEDAAMYEACQSLGFKLFQGYHIERPTLQRGRKLGANKQSLMQLVAKLSRSDIDPTEVAELITTDPTLMVKILKIVNCPLYPFKREITHVREAVVMLGIDVVKQWAMILSMVAASDQPSELFRTLLVRAKVCELYANEMNKKDFQDQFMLGLFSGLDAVLGLPMEDLLEVIPFPEHIKKALLTPEQAPKGILSLVKKIEQNPNQEVLETSFIAKLSKCYWDGTSWADELMKVVES